MTELPASEATRLALNYFQAPRGYFWRWAEKGEVVEWLMGPTICYREELHAVLDKLVVDSLPPLGSVLLVLAACSESWPNIAASVDFFRIIKELELEPDTENELLAARDVAVGFLRRIHALPQELRTGPAKLHLIREVLLGSQAADLEPVYSGVPPTAEASQRLLVLAEWTSGRLDLALTKPGDVVESDEIGWDLKYFRRASQRFPTTEALALYLRTGLDKLPEPLPKPPLPEPEPEPEPTDLLDQLGQDARTHGLALLTRRLTAALRIPLHTHAASEQPLGGVADISNRGAFDRLLLSELAQDEDMLLARLAGNEALYLRREAPPTPDPHPHVILLDTTLRLWGVPRVFGLAAALAWTRQPRPARRATPVVACALGGQTATDLDLSSFDGVVQALERLDVAAHAGPALLEFLGTPAATGADCLLITAAELLSQPDFGAALAEARLRLRYLLTVDRSGELQLYEYRHGQRQLLSTTRYDLDELLFAPMPTPRRPRRPGRPGEPAYLAQQPAPLYFPSASLKVNPKTAFFHPKLGLLAVNEQQRVLFYPDRQFGARELLAVIEAGQYHFGYDDGATVYGLVEAAERQLVFYALDTATGAVERTELAEAHPLNHPLTLVAYLAGCFYLRFGSNLSIDVTVFDCRRRHVVVRHHGPMPKPAQPGFHMDRGQLKQHVNNGYSVLQNVQRLGLSPTGELTIDGRALRLWQYPQGQSQHLRLLPLAPDERAQRTIERSHGTPLLDNPQLWLGHFTWPDGSRAWIDSRGLLHLRSADPTVPEITVVLIVELPTAAWAADGTVCGPAYFTGAQPALSVTPVQFYRQYIQRFIDRLLTT